MTTPTAPASQSFVRVIIMAGIAAIGGLLFGFNEGIIAGAIVSIKKQWVLTPLAEGVIVSSVLLGGLVGAAIGGKAADAFGRRAVISATAAFFVVGAFWTGLASTPEWLIAGRILIGLSIGTVSVAGPLYLSEIAPASIRGALVSFNQLALVIGVLCSYVVSAAFSGTEEGWRYMLMAGAAPAVVLGYGMLFLPSSPRWLMTKGYEGSARRMLRRLGIQDIDAAIAEIKQSLNTGATGTWREVLQPHLRLALVIGFGLMIFQQFSGINIVILYAPSIFEMVGFSGSTSAPLLTVGIGVTNLVMTLVAIGLIDRLGRKPLFLYGIAVMMLCLLILAFGFSGMAGSSVIVGYLVVGSLFTFVAAFALSLGAVCGLIVSEIYPQQVRGAAMGIVIVVNWVCQIIVALTYPTLVATFGAAMTFLLYAAIGAAGFLFCYFLVPETRGLTLEQIEQNWRDGKPPRKW